MIRSIPWLGLALLAACGQYEDSVCNQLCTELINQCGYEAFPSNDSCLQGCLYDADQGADIQGQLDCVEAAECDTFAIVECQHAASE